MVCRRASPGPSSSSGPATGDRGRRPPVRRAWLPRHVGRSGRGRGRLHQGRRLLELRVEGRPVLRRVRARRGARHRRDRARARGRAGVGRAGSTPWRSRQRGGAAATTAGSRSSSSSGRMSCVGRRCGPFRGDPPPRAGSRSWRRSRPRARHGYVLPDDPRKLTVALYAMQLGLSLERLTAARARGRAARAAHGPPVPR